MELVPARNHNRHAAQAKTLVWRFVHPSPFLPNLVEPSVDTRRLGFWSLVSDVAFSACFRDLVHSFGSVERVDGRTRRVGTNREGLLTCHEVRM